MRTKLLENGNENFDKLLSRAKMYEVVNEQKKIFDHKNDNFKASMEPTYKISSRNPNIQTFSKQQNNIMCNRCGYKGHRAADDKCPAKGKKCNKCGLEGHFAKKCRTKEGQSNAKRARSDTINQPDAKRPKIENNTEDQTV